MSGYENASNKMKQSLDAFSQLLETERMKLVELDERRVRLGNEIQELKQDIETDSKTMAELLNKSCDFNKEREASLTRQFLRSIQKNGRCQKGLKEPKDESSAALEHNCTNNLDVQTVKGTDSIDKMSNEENADDTENASSMEVGSIVSEMSNLAVECNSAAQQVEEKDCSSDCSIEEGSQEGSQSQSDIENTTS